MSHSPILRRAAALLAVALLAVACSSGGAETPAAGPNDSARTSPVTRSLRSGDVTIRHRYGSTTITGTPRRVVTVGLTDQDAVLALGVTPVGTTEWFGAHPSAIWPWARDRVSGPAPELVGDAQAVNFEKVAALRPDVVIALYAGLTKQDYQTLSRIAPTVAQPKPYVDYGIPWDELTLTVGRILGKEAKAQGLVGGIEDRLAAIKQEHPEFDGATGLVATPYQGTVSVYAPEDARGRFLASLGFEQPKEIAKLAGDNFSADLSLERLDLLDVDVLVWILHDIESNRATMNQAALYRRLPVHTEGREVFVANLSELGGATSFVSVLSLPILLDQLVPQIADAMGDGAPASG